MKRRTLILIGSALAVVATVAATAIPMWRTQVAVRHDDRLLAVVTRSLSERRPAEALALINRRTPLAKETPERTARWTKAEVEAAASSVQLARLAAIYQRNPAPVLADENASLLLARAYVHSRDAAGYSALRDAWKPRTTHPDGWFALEVDHLLVTGQPDEARQLLESTKLDGTADIVRLTRLALLNANGDLKQSWNRLAEAVQLDPRNADVRLFRGQILERIGKLPLARVEYVAAHLADAANPWHADQLAEFYRRQGNTAAAIEVWQKALAATPVDYLWLKQWFWSRVAVPGSAKAPALPENGTLAGFGKALASLPAEEFWKPEWSSAETRLGANRQEAFWLQLLDALRRRDEATALQLLAFRKERAQSWAPELESALWRILSYRAGGSLTPAELPLTTNVAADQHQFFTQLTAAAKGAPDAIPTDFDRLLKSDEAFATAFICAGWLRAGLDLRPDAPLAADLPTWLGYTDTQALRYVRGAAPALAFARQLPHTPELDVLVAELEIATGQTDEARALLATNATQPGAAGFRAAWLLTLAQIGNKEFDLAEKTLSAQPELAASPTGQELRARIAYLRGDSAKAAELYQSIVVNSSEARAFLARRAFAAKDWPTARRLTTELIELMPDQMQLRENLAAIARAEQQPKP